ncbi:MAG: CBS domain-containing protein [Planctomycetota bacterium]
MYVRNWMTGPALTVAPGVNIEEARGLMEKKKVRRLPVVQADRLVGIVTRSDIEAQLGRARGLTLRELYRALDTRVEEVMTPDPVTVRPDDTFEHAAGVMREHRISGLPVVDEGKVVGVITETDMFRAITEMLGLDGEGERLVVPVTSPEGLLEALKRFSKGLGVRSLVTYHDPQTRRWIAVVRVFGRPKANNRKRSRRPAAVSRK